MVSVTSAIDAAPAAAEEEHASEADEPDRDDDGACDEEDEVVNVAQEGAAETKGGTDQSENKANGPAVAGESVLP